MTLIKTVLVTLGKNTIFVRSCSRRAWREKTTYKIRNQVQK